MEIKIGLQFICENLVWEIQTDGVDDYWGWNWPVHEVMLQGFEIGAYEVTQAQYAAVIGNNPSFFQGNDNNPVVEVSWYDARTFCTQLSVMTGRTFTLPSEAQWEYACRAGTTTLYSFGDDDTLLGNYAWYSTNSGNQTHPIGTKLPNNWGLYDMHGNVDELCLDSYHENYTDAPADGSAWDPEISTYRMLRGGSYFRVEWYCQSAHRDIDQPDFRYFTYGFRVVAVR